MRSNALIIVLFTLALSSQRSLQACELKADKVGEIMGVAATTTSDGVVRVGWPRKDVEVAVDGGQADPERVGVDARQLGDPVVDRPAAVGQVGGMDRGEVRVDGRGHGRRR